VASGYWPLIRYDPVLRQADRNPFLLDSHRPRIPLTSYTGRELRYRILERTHPEAAERLLSLAQQQVNQRWATYEEMASHGPNRFPGGIDGTVRAAVAEVGPGTMGSDDES
jgi:pyruvate-ferredoxin/flavodoxin oxidoreductase